MISKIRTKFMSEGLLRLGIAIVMYPFSHHKRRAYRNMLNLENPKDKFSKIYQKNLWSSSESGSGEGSEVNYTLPLREWLIKTITRLKIKSLVDAPCGDFNWMKIVLPQLDIRYIGIDIVDDVIEKNIAKYNFDNVSFIVSNICEDRLPDCDIIMVRDCLFHLSYKDINSFLINLSKTNYIYLLTTTHIVDQKFKNSNIITGDFRIIDLFSEPFNFDSKRVMDRVDDFPTGHSIKREMILVEKRFVPTHMPKLDSRPSDLAP
jgi:hypothetical protein